MATKLTEAVSDNDVLSESPMEHGKHGALRVEYGNGVTALVKQKQFRTGKFRGVSYREAHLHEVAAYLLDRDVFKFGFVPETVVGSYKGSEASVQLFVTGKTAPEIVPDVFNYEKERWKFRLSRFFAKMDLQQLARLVAFDLALGSTDRHARNVLFTTGSDGSWRTGRVWAIDNGNTLGEDLAYYRNVFHKYLFLTKFDLPTFIADLFTAIKRREIEDALLQVLPADVALTHAMQVHARIRWVLAHRKDLSFYTLSHGEMDKDGFPSYSNELDLLRRGKKLVVTPPSAREARRGVLTKKA